MAKRGSGSIVCPVCGKSDGYIRLKTRERVCRGCGNVWKLKKEANDEEVQ